MKKILLLAYLFSIVLFSSAQSADERIGMLLNANDLFVLEEEYPKLSADMQVPMLKALAESVLNASFNRSAEAVNSIDKLINNYADDLGASNINNMRGWQHMILFRMGEYDNLAQRISEYVTDLKKQSNSANTNGLYFYEKFFSCMAGQDKSKLIRPDENCEIPIFIEKIKGENLREGHLLYVPVTVHGEEEKFIFDTGCPGGAFMSEEYARKFNVHITMDSLTVGGVGGTGWGKMGVLDSINIGNMVFKNLTVTVVPPNPVADSIVPINIDLVLGSDIMRHAGEVQILPKQNKMIFPSQKTLLPTTGRNMYINGGDHFFIKCYSGKERLIMHFDTGDSSAGLHANYYQRHKEEVERLGTKETSKAGGFGGLIDIEYYKLPKLPLRMGNVNFEMKDLTVHTDDKASVVQAGEAGSLGMDFIRLFDKVTINFDDMFVEVE